MMSNKYINPIKTPDDWKQSVLDYQNQNIEDLKLQLEQNEKRFHKNVSTNASKNPSFGRKLHPVKVCILAAAITILACGCVLAYDIVSKNQYFALSRAVTSWFNNTSDEHIQKVNESATVDNMKLTLTRITTENGALIFEIKAKTTDGSDFYKVENQEKALRLRSRFSDIKVLIDGTVDSSTTYSAGTFRIDDESNPKEATFEVYYRTNTAFAGKNITLQLSDIEHQWVEPEDSGMTDQTLYELFDGVTLADSSTFHKYEIQSKESITGETYYYTPPVGDMHIAISDTYPDCYIDNAGFGECMIGGKAYACLYIGITTNSEEEYRALYATSAYNPLTITNASTVLNNAGSIAGIEENRLVSILVPGRDDYWKVVENITDPMVIDRNFLKQYKLATLGTKSIKGTRAYKGTWSFDMTVSEKIYE